MPAGPAESQVLEEEIDEAYEPTQAEITEYANWLGMDLAADQALLWLAREGLKAPLPPDWKPCKSPEGEIYYFNFTSGESVWDHPCDGYYREQYQDEKKKLAAKKVLEQRERQEKEKKRAARKKEKAMRAANPDRAPREQPQRVRPRELGNLTSSRGAPASSTGLGQLRAPGIGRKEDTLRQDPLASMAPAADELDDGIDAQDMRRGDADVGRERPSSRERGDERPISRERGDERPTSRDERRRSATRSATPSDRSGTPHFDQAQGDSSDSNSGSDERDSAIALAKLQVQLRKAAATKHEQFVAQAQAEDAELRETAKQKIVDDAARAASRRRRELLARHQQRSASLKQELEKLKRERTALLSQSAPLESSFEAKRAVAAEVSARHGEQLEREAETLQGMLTKELAEFNASAEAETSKLEAQVAMESVREAEAEQARLSAQVGAAQAAAAAAQRELDDAEIESSGVSSQAAEHESERLAEDATHAAAMSAALAKLEG